MTLIEMKLEISIIEEQRGLIISFTKHDVKTRQRMVEEADRLIEHYNEKIKNGEYEAATVNEQIGRI